MESYHVTCCPLEVFLYGCGFPCTPYSFLHNGSRLLAEEGAKPLWQCLRHIRTVAPVAAQTYLNHLGKLNAYRFLKSLFVYHIYVFNCNSGSLVGECAGIRSSSQQDLGDYWGEFTWVTGLILEGPDAVILALIL